MSVHVHPLPGALGARIEGVDLSKDLDTEDLSAIRAAWQEHLVIVIPGQSLEPERQIAFGNHFGGLQEIRTRQNAADKGQGFMYVANRSVDGMEGFLPDGEMQFHTDQCYYETPSRATILHAIEVPSQGGNTRFANAARAYDTLPQATRSRIEGLQALNAYDYDTDATHKPDKVRDDAPQAVHPVVIRHPDSGRPVLYVNRLMTFGIVGIDRAESDALLKELFAALEAEDNVYEHVWTPGDVVMWDNLATLHARTDFDPAEARVMRRTSVAGQRPEAAFPIAA